MILPLFLLISLNIVHSRFLPDGDYSKGGIDNYWNYISDSYEKANNKYSSKYTSSLETKKHPYFHCYSVYRTATDDWCQDNCQLGYCPTSHCICTTGQPKFVTSNKAMNSKYVYDDNGDNDEQQKQNDFDSYQWDSNRNELRYQ
ncbi:hypothetical protein BLA29_004949 [Euroglyphus maynei]|uniref:Uncharacterized protein n=1 Tax=Euroglyphus maynei TaxID=6958 RepID=A0A1Y3BFU1_EURMA|nr:hypothetical protein BLA29_004949 [Euroglyphus maynei]